MSAGSIESRRTSKRGAEDVAAALVENFGKRAHLEAKRRMTVSIDSADIEGAILWFDAWTLLPGR